MHFAEGVLLGSFDLLFIVLADLPHVGVRSLEEASDGGVAHENFDRSLPGAPVSE